MNYAHLPLGALVATSRGTGQILESGHDSARVRFPDGFEAWFSNDELRVLGVEEVKHLPNPAQARYPAGKLGPGFTEAQGLLNYIEGEVDRLRGDVARYGAVDDAVGDILDAFRTRPDANLVASSFALGDRSKSNIYGAAFGKLRKQGLVWSASPSIVGNAIWQLTLEGRKLLGAPLAPDVLPSGFVDAARYSGVVRYAEGSIIGWLGSDSVYVGDSVEEAERQIRALVDSPSFREVSGGQTLRARITRGRGQQTPVKEFSISVQPFSEPGAAHYAGKYADSREVSAAQDRVRKALWTLERAEGENKRALAELQQSPDDDAYMLPLQDRAEDAYRRLEDARREVELAEDELDRLAPDFAETGNLRYGAETRDRAGRFSGSRAAGRARGKRKQKVREAERKAKGTSKPGAVTSKKRAARRAERVKQGRALKKSEGGLRLVYEAAERARNAPTR